MPLLQTDNQIRDALASYPLIDRVFKLSAERDMPIYLVGGTVRDLVLGRATHDLDFVVEGSGLALARYVADQLGGAFVPLDRERSTGRVLLSHPAPAQPSPDTTRLWLPQHLDIASLRGEDLRADLAGRDFTLNAMAIARTANGWRIDDPLDGRKDLRRRILRMASSSSFDSDPVRTLRAVRMQHQFGCTIEPETRDRLRSAVPLLKRVSAERVRDEWFKILALGDAATALGKMAQFGLLDQVAPMIAPTKSLDHALATVRATERLWAALQAPAHQSRSRPEGRFADSVHHLAPHIWRRYTALICDERGYLALLKCAALLHETDSSGTTLASLWKLSKREGELLHQAIHHYSDVQALAKNARLTRRMIYVYFAQTGEHGVDAAILSLAHSLASGTPSHDSEAWKHQVRCVAQLLCAWFEHRDTQIAPVPLLSGKEIMRVLSQQAGPQIGELLQNLAQEQAAGEILTRQQALAYVQQWKTRGPGKKRAKEQARDSDG
jgi:tRNA nucleotidyltransferase/poly(A) polymerase